MGNNPQSGRKPGTFTNVPIQYPQPWNAVRPDMVAENSHVANFGVLFTHYSAMPDPIHNKVTGSLRQSFDHASAQQFEKTDRWHRENGFLYIKKEKVYVVFSSNSKDAHSLPAGSYFPANVHMTLNRYYQDTNNVVRIAEGDKLIPAEPLIKEFLSTNYQKVVSSPTNIMRLQFKAVEIEALVDSDGVMYEDGVDYELVDGSIKWIPGGNQPGQDMDTLEGKIMSVRYLYQPYFYVNSIIHDIRIKPAIDENGEVVGKAGPIALMAVADYVYLDRKEAEEQDVSADSPLISDSGDNSGPR